MTRAACGPPCLLAVPHGLPKMAQMRRFILTVCALGFVLCMALLLLSWLAPLQVERWARAAIERDVRRRASLQLLAPTVVLLGAAALVACCYLFSQNWLQTILLSDYVGWTYAPWLGLVIAALADVVWNRARICSMLVNGVLNGVGAAASAVPC